MRGEADLGIKKLSLRRKMLMAHLAGSPRLPSVVKMRAALLFLLVAFAIWQFLFPFLKGSSGFPRGDELRRRWCSKRPNVDALCVFGDYLFKCTRLLDVNVTSRNTSAPSAACLGGDSSWGVCTDGKFLCQQPGAWTIRWDGPFVGTFLASGIVHSRFSSLQEGQRKCEAIDSCAGLTGSLREDRTYEWEIRIGNSVWLERSKSSEISWRIHPAVSSLLVPPVSLYCIGLPRRMDRSRGLFESFLIAGFDVGEVRWSKGVDRDNYVSADDMLVGNSFPPVVSWNFEWDYSRDLHLDRVKGKVGAWLAHLNVWRQMLLSAQNTSVTGWAVIMEDDVLFVDSKGVFLEKMAVTSLLHPEAEMIYLMGRELPDERSFGRLSYVGVDAYALKYSAAAKILSLCLLNSPVVDVLALDAHLSALSIAGVVEARALVGGNAFVNRWSETASDIEER